MTEINERIEFLSSEKTGMFPRTYLPKVSGKRDFRSPTHAG